MKPRAKKYEQYANIFCIRTCFSEVIKVYYTPQTSHVQPFLRDLINILQKEQLSTENKKNCPRSSSWKHISYEQTNCGSDFKYVSR